MTGGGQGVPVSGSVPVSDRAVVSGGVPASAQPHPEAPVGAPLRTPLRALAGAPPVPGAGMVAAGRLVRARGPVWLVRLEGAGLGAVVEVEGAPGRWVRAQVVGFDEDGVWVMPCGVVADIRPGATVRLVPLAERAPCPVASAGRVLDAFGRCLRSGAAMPAGDEPVRGPAPAALQRPPIVERVWTGLRVIDGLLPLARGQRVGLFAGSGVGKSTLLGQVAAGVAADAVVVGLIGERGREVGEMVELLAASSVPVTVVVATSDEPALRRVRAAELATALACAWRRRGAHCLLLLDSLTRYARALREVALASGEAPARRGYPASVFARLPEVIERAGAAGTGAVTAVYTVLVDGGDMEERIADEVRGLVDGHWVLDRELARCGHYPAVDVLSSVSRLAGHVCGPEELDHARAVRAALALLSEHRDAIDLGLYVPGSRPALDLAIAVREGLRAFLVQGVASDGAQACAQGEVAAGETRAWLAALAREVEP